ncbi:indole-3-glycerol-phosphate synthase TrpC [Flavobacterium sp. Sd200]|uniref:indole-3-glycerol phosphate synthase TrpC n=1 Tax=Flavobacterium sp. Sd200 TaxID=2692211 RepID=UPI00136D5B74|nr:indole-3-glycerol phosphate synthase TrpC [Flavobacterium sp. Sd200]MXN89965.1 indole-3-glycerol-phosphate synthase TrpC [Flavobacterium sp. Sd200]
MNVLEQIVANKRREVALLQQDFSVDYFRESENFSRESVSLKQSIINSGFGIIAEIKRKSPSGGDIKTGLNVAEQALFYEQNGASGISILTDSDYFGGSINDITTARNKVSLPLLRKEFIIDEIQLYEAKAAGADAVLLIAAVLNHDEANFLTLTAHTLGLEVLFEIHTEQEIDLIPMHADLVAVNNRDLKAQQTSLQHSFNLIGQLPKHIPVISASGIKTREDIETLRKAGFSGALIGESILREGHLAELTRKL